MSLINMKSNTTLHEWKYILDSYQILIPTSQQFTFNIQPNCCARTKYDQHIPKIQGALTLPYFLMYGRIYKSNPKLNSVRIILVSYSQKLISGYWHFKGNIIHKSKDKTLNYGWVSIEYHITGVLKPWIFRYTSIFKTEMFTLMIRLRKWFNTLIFPLS